MEQSADRVHIKSFPDYKHYKKTTVRGIQTYFFSQKCNSKSFLQRPRTRERFSPPIGGPPRGLPDLSPKPPGPPPPPPAPSHFVLRQNIFLATAVPWCCGTYLNCQQGYWMTRRLDSWSVLTFRKYLLPPSIRRRIPYLPLRAAEIWRRFRMEYANFGDFTQRRMVVCHRGLGAVYRFHLQNSSYNAWILKLGPIACPETSIRKYHSALRRVPRECMR